MKARRWGLAGAALAIAAGSAALVAVAAASRQGSRPDDGLQAPLGDEARCAAYSGVPAQWRRDPHAGMVQLAAGSFVFGSDRGYPDERPASAKPLRVGAFWIDRTEVTVAQFASFVEATGYVTEAERQGGAVVFRQPTAAQLAERPYAWWVFVKGADWRHPGGPGSTRDGLDNRPITFVTRADALAYARWLGRDLPTEAEWEYAGKAGQTGRTGDVLDTAPRDDAGRPGANYWQGVFPAVDLHEDGHAGVAPVGCYRPNPWGLHDMIGNVWEWTRDRYTGPRQPHLNGDTAAVAAPARASNGASNEPIVIKGGSYLCSPDFCVRYRASAREAQEADLATAHIGFRTVQRDATP